MGNQLIAAAVSLKLNNDNYERYKKNNWIKNMVMDHISEEYAYDICRIICYCIKVMINIALLPDFSFYMMKPQ